MAGPHSHYNPGASVHVPHVSRFHKGAVLFLGGSFWFWVMYRVKNDFPVMAGWRKPWESPEEAKQRKALENK